MPQVAIDPNQSAMMQELLRQRGLLATGGNIRQLPFDNVIPSDGSGNGSVVNGQTPSSNGAAVAPSDAEPLVDPNGELVDPRTQAPLDDTSAADWWKYLLAGGAVAGGAALLNALRKRFTGRQAVGSDGVPVVEGEVMPNDPLAPLPDNRPIVDGQFTEVVPDGLPAPANANAPTAAQAIAQRKALPPPKGKLPDYPSPPKYLTSKEIAERKAANRGVGAKSGPAIPMADALTEFSPEEISAAKVMAQRLMQERLHGNKKQRAGKNVTLINRKDMPSVTGGATGDVNEEGLLNTIISILRSNKAAIRTAVP